VFDQLLRYRVPILIIFLAVAGAALPGIFDLQLSPDNRTFYSLEDPKYKNLLEFEETFRPSSTLTFVVTAPTPIASSDPFAAALVWLTEHARLLPYARRVDSLSTIPHLHEYNDTVTSQSILEYVCSPVCDGNRQNALNDPALIRRFVSDDLRTVSVIVALDFTIKSVDAVSSIDRAAERIIEQFSLHGPEYRILKTGTIPLMQSYVDATFNDLSSVLLLASAAIVALMLVTIGDGRMTLLMLFLGLFSIGITMGIAGYAGLVIVTSTAIIPLIIFTVVTASSMHMLLHVVRSFSLDGMVDVQSAFLRAFEANWPPILLATGTTIAGLLSLLFVESQPIKDIGTWAATGVLIGAVLTLTVLPIVGCLFVKRPNSVFQAQLQKLLNKYARRIESGNAITWIFTGLFAACLVGIAGLRIDDDFVRYLSSENTFRQDTEYSASRLSSLNQLDVWIKSDTDEILSPQSIQFQTELASYLRSHPTVSNVYSIIDVLQNVNEHFGSNEDLNDYTSSELTQLFWAYDLSLGEGQSSADLVDSGFANARMSVFLHDVTSSQIRDLNDTISAWLIENRELTQDSITAEVTGEGIPISYLSTNNIPAMAKGITLSLLLSSILLGSFYKNVRIAIIGFVATAVPVVCGFGIYGLITDSIGLAATVIVAVAVGVVIDDAIHMIYRHQDGRNNLDLSPDEAAAYSIYRAGSAVITTTLILVCGFVALLASDFRLNGTFGLCTSIIFLVAMLFDLFSLPRLLVWRCKDA
jgi:predicted RND superfamily exporter protein